ncbi:hypothetical protein FIE12Z_2962 [Fusarium flagelliforme]|uniref:Uncharacterized protein n=1 Tax=Fusarium flagelliforme TaxID=2675880 RepID=A0A395MZ77_9HYPO|nr:hypothetical protein FIE12Z_2962 [Fusarium flagelliforme]
MPLKIDKPMATIFLPRIASPDSKDRNVPRTMTSSHSPSFKTTVPGDRDNNDDGIKTEIKTETVWETMNPYTETSEASTSAATSRPRTKIAATPTTTTTTTTKNDANYSTTSPTAIQSPESLAPEFQESRGLSDGAIAAVVLGVVFGLAAIALAAWFLFYKRHRGSTINRATSPQTPIYNPPPPSSPLPTPPPIAELSSQGDGSPSMEDSWASYGDRVRSPTPQPAVAEVKSFTRTWQKPRVYTVGGGRIAELHGSEPSTSNDDGDDKMSPISPLSRAGLSLADRRVVSPVSLTSRFSTLSSRADSSPEQEASPRRGF